MKLEVDEILALRKSDPPGLTRMLRASFVVHLGAVLILLVVPSSWYARPRADPVLMTINLGGAPGERSTGMTAAGGRAVEEVAPPPPRPVPVRPAATEPDRMAVPDREAETPPPPKPETVTPPGPRPREAAPGRELSRGTSAAETGASGEASGLSFGGGGGTAASVSDEFCGGRIWPSCREYVNTMLGEIGRHWQKSQPERGFTVVTFTVERGGGRVVDVQVVSSSGSGLLNRAARAALNQALLPPLPADYLESALSIRLTFPYGVQ
jgi:TonB family protein